MKLCTVIALTVLLVAKTVTSKDECLAECATTLFDSYEGDCAKWRDELPRPDLFLHCQKGYLVGRDKACEEMCSNEPNERKLDSLRLDACQEFKGTPPRQRVTACNEGFVAAQVRSQGFLNYKTKKNKGDADTKPKISVKRQIEAKNILEQAREEAKAAFQDAKSEEL